MTADSILSRQDRAQRGGGGEEAATATDAAEAWLMRALEGEGRARVDALHLAAASENIAWRTVERAKARLWIRARHVGVPGVQGGGAWWWFAPGHRDTKPDGNGGDGPDGVESVKTAKQIPLAVLPQAEGDGSRKSAFGKGLRTRGKAAKVKTVKGALADSTPRADIAHEALASADGGEPAATWRGAP